MDRLSRAGQSRCLAVAGSVAFRAAAGRVRAIADSRATKFPPGTPLPDGKASKFAIERIAGLILDAARVVETCRIDPERVGTVEGYVLP